MLHRQVVNSGFVSPESNLSIWVIGSQEEGAARGAENAVFQFGHLPFLVDAALIYNITSSEKDERGLGMAPSGMSQNPGQLLFCLICPFLECLLTPKCALADREWDVHRWDCVGL